MEMDDRLSRPSPDPTLLTTEALQREVASLERLLEQRVGAVLVLLEQRIKGIVETRAQEFKTVDEKFAAVQQGLNLVEQQRVEQKKDTKDAVDAALTAQKEAVSEQTTASERSIAKSEAATTKSIEQLQETFTTALEGQRREIGDLKERVAAAESNRTGREAQTTEHRAAIQPFQIAMIALVSSGLLGLLGYLAGHH